jgi:Lon protease-like protein
MVLLKPGSGADSGEPPPIYTTGCTGLITHVETLEDGRYNLVLRGIEKFTVHGEEEPAGDPPYRRALVTTIDETIAVADREPLKLERRRLEAYLTPFFEGALAEHRLPATMPDEDLINALAQYMEFEPLEKLALLERQGPLARCRSMIELLEMKTLLKRSSGDAGMIH